MKKILFLMLMAIVMLPSVLRAQQTLTVADGTTTNEYVPVYGYYCDSYVRCQTIYPENMVEDMIGGTIESMTFYATSSSVNWGSSFIVKIGTTNASTLNNNWDNSLTTQVYSGVLSVDANGAMMVNFSTPFTYDGGNLLVDIYSTTIGSYISCYFNGISATGASTRGYNYDDITSISPMNQDFIPKTTFGYTAGIMTCPAVSNLTASNVDDQNATVTWSPRGTESNWDIYLATSSTDVPDEYATPTYTSTDTTYDFYGLNSSTHYYVYVRANCGAGDVSSWRNVSFMTSQVAAQLPYTCDFEDATENANWTLQNNGVNNWYIGSAVNTTIDGLSSLYISSNNGSSNTYNNESISTAWAYRDIDFGTHGEYIINFKYRNEGESDYYDYLKVYVGPPAEPTTSGSSSGSGCTPAGAVLLGTYSENSSWQEASLVVPGTYSGIQRLYFFWWNDDSAGDNPPAAVDDIEITYSDCGVPSSLVTTGISANDVTIHFEPALATDNAWEAMICSATDTVVESIFDTTYTFLNLTPNTQYTIKVRTDCGNDEYSRWTNAISVRTNCATYVAPFTETFANFSTGMSPCWHRYSGLASDIFAGTATLSSTTSGWLFSNSNVFPLGHPKVNVYGTSCKYWLVTPDIDLSALANPTLTFSLALTAYGSTSPISNPANQADDKFMVIVSTDGGSTWSESNATVWSDDATIADYPYSTISNQGQEVQIDLTQYAGQTVQIAFYTESTVSGGDNDIHIADVVVGEPITCFKPGPITIDSLDAEQVFFSWSPVGTESTWEYICVPAGTDVADDAVWEVAYDTTANVMNLSGNTLYDLYLRASCGSSEYSVPRIISFRTECGMAAVPYTENFDSYTSGSTIPCWTVLGGTVAAYNDNSYSHSGSYSLKFSSSTNNMIALMPFTTEISDLEMTFYTRPESFSSSSCGTFSVGYVTDINNPSSFVAVETYSYNDFSGVTEKTVIFANAPAGSQIAFRHVPTSTIWYWFVDDIDVHEIPTCLRPSQFAVTGTTPTSVSLSWTEDGTADTWNVVYGPTGFTIDENSNMEVVYTTPSVTIDNLTAGTIYDFYVQSDCGSDVSLWRGPITVAPGSYNMPTSGTDTLHACGVTIYDNGGAMGNYSDNCDGYVVLFPEVDGQYVSVNGTITAESSSFDYVEIYDGVGTSHLLYKSNQSSSTTLSFGPFTSSTGPLTIRFRSDGSNNYAGLVLNTECITCVSPAVTVSNIDMYEATLTWGDNFGQATAWQIVYGPAGFSMAGATPEDVYTNSITLSNLNPNTAYDFYIRTDCGDGSYSMWSAATNFMTLAGTPAPTPYFCDFEDAEENSAWALVNGSNTNQWYIGMPTGATDSILYISSDNGATAGYEIGSMSNVWAYRDIAFGTGAEFNLSFNWKAYGESCCDYFKVYMGSPASVVAGSETAPENAVLLIDKLNMQNNWQHVEQFIGGQYANTVQRLYFFWHNDGSVGTAPAAMIDSIQVTVSDCGRPQGLTASNITTNGFDVTFSPALTTDANWEYVVCAAGASPDAATPEIASDTTFSVTGLSSSTTYDVYVRTVCDAGGYSAWSSALVVSTACGAIETLPYTNNFDVYGTGSSVYPMCWSKINTYSSDRPYITTTNFSAPGSLYFYAGTSGTYNMAITPEFDAAIAMNTLQVTFKYRTTYSSDRMIVGVMTDPTDATTFEAIDTVSTSTTSTWEDAEVFLNNYTGNGHYIAFKNDYTTTSSYGYLDNLVVDLIPSCSKPRNLATTDVTTNSITLSWNEVGSATAWNIEYGPAGFTQGTGTTVAASTNPFTVTGLTASTLYDFYVQSDCGGGDASAWSDVATVATSCEAISLPYTENFDSYVGTTYNTPGPTPLCWATTTTNTSYPAPHVVSSSSSTTYCYPHSGTNCMVFTCGSAGADAYAILPEFDQPLNTLHLNFYRQMESSTSGTLTVGYVTSSSNTSSFVTVATIPSLSSTGDTISVDFTGANVPANGNIAFHWNYSSSYYSCCIDDINVTQAGNPGPGTTCDAPTNVNASNVAQTTATITWTPGGDETSWNLQYKAAADANWSSNITVNNTPSYALTGLTANTAYQVRVQAVCDANNVSDWANGTFTTLNQDEPTCPAPTNVAANDITKNSAVITWSQEPNTASSWTVLYKQSAASSWETATANAMTYTLSGLNADTQYDVQVMANCDNGMQSAASETIHFTTLVDGVNNYVLDAAISVYPNPTNGQFTIDNEQCTINSVEVYDVYGKLIGTTKVDDTHVTLDINTYADGVYFARILTDKGVVTKRIVKK